MLMHHSHTWFVIALKIVEGYLLYTKVPVDVCQLLWSAAICLHKSHEIETRIIYQMFQNHETMHLYSVVFRNNGVTSTGSQLTVGG